MLSGNCPSLSGMQLLVPRSPLVSAPSHRRLPVSTKPIEDDIDVANERHRVLRGDADNDMLKIENLTKVGAASGCKETLSPAQGCGWGIGSRWLLVG